MEIDESASILASTNVPSQYNRGAAAAGMAPQNKPAPLGGGTNQQKTSTGGKGIEDAIIKKG